MRINRAILAVVIIPIAAAALASVAIAEIPYVQYLGQIVPTGSPPNFGGGGNSFERRIDLSGSLAVVGSGIFNTNADLGRVHVFDTGNPNSIHQIAELRASDHAPGDNFANGVAIAGKYVFVGASGTASDRGAVYMYDVSDPLHVVERKITAFDSAPKNYFGHSLAVDGTKLIVGAPKFSASTLPPAAYVIDFSDPNHLQQTKISNPLATSSGYAEAVAISGSHALVGYYADPTSSPASGSAFLYDISNPNAIVQQRLTATIGTSNTDFGRRVSISGTKAVVAEGGSGGSVWAFDFSDWNNIQESHYEKSLADNLAYGDSPFGRFLDLQGNLAIEGAFNEDSIHGGVYLHDISNIFSPSKLFRLPAHSTADSRFGISLALDGRMLLVSDELNHVYLYRVVPEPGCLSLAVMACGVLICHLRRERRLACF